MLQVFKTLPVARATYRSETLPSAAREYPHDTIPLGWEERLKARGRRRSDAGVEFGTALARGTTLREGDAFVFDDPRLVVYIIEKQETVFVVVPATPAEWALFAYHIGNSHQPMMITDEAIVCPDVPGVEQVLTYHAIPYSQSIQPFTPVSLTGDVYGANHVHRP